MKICIFTSAHLVNDIRVFKKELLSLLKEGYSITYYTNKINQNMDQKFVKNVEKIEYPNLKIVYNNNYNEDQRFKRFLRSFLILFKMDKKCDIYHFHDPDLLIAGFFLKLIGKKVIYDVHENYVDTISEKEYIPQKLRKAIVYLFEKLENFCAKKYDAIICATPSISERFKKIGMKNVVIINNYPFKNELNMKINTMAKDNIIIYTGGITEKRGIYQLIKAIEFVNEKMDCRLILAGEIYPKEFYKRLKKMNGWKYVEYKGLLSREDMAKELSKAKLGVVLFLPEKNHIEAQPNKLFEYMSAKLPIICSNFPLWEEIVTKNNIGVSADPTDPNNIANAIIDFLNFSEEKINTMRERAKYLIDTKYNWENEEKKLINLYKNLEGK